MTSKGATIDVGAWLRDLGLGQYEATFRENAINEKVLPNLTAPLRCCALAQTHKLRRHHPRRCRQRRLLPLQRQKPVASAAKSR
jgi:SAM domain (Sterile alpha motif)